MGAARRRSAGGAGRAWWLHLLRGVVALLLGASVLAAGRAQPFLVNFIAIYWLIGSLLTIRWALASRGRPGRRLAAAAALAGVLAAVVVLLRFPLSGAVSRELTLHLLGAAAILTGLLRLAGAFRDDAVTTDRPRLSHRTLIGGLEIALGIVLVLADEVTRPIAVLAGLWGLVGGTLLLVDALALRRRGDAVRD